MGGPLPALRRPIEREARMKKTLLRLAGVWLGHVIATTWNER